MLSQARPFIFFFYRSDKISGKIRSITDFGVFVGLDGDIDGLVHLSDLSWVEIPEEAVRNYKKGDDLDAVILGIDAERERISLGVKQLLSDPILEYVEAHKDTAITATVKIVDIKQATLSLTADIEGVMKLADYTYDRVKDLRQELKDGQELQVKIMGIDPKTRQIQLSAKVLETKPDNTGSRAVGADSVTKTTLGDLLKEQMQHQKDRE